MYAQRPAGEAPTEKIRQQPHPPAGYPAQGGQLPPAASPDEKKRSGLRSPKSIILIAVIIVSLVLCGLVGGEFYARSEANSRLVTVAECLTKDKVTVSVDSFPPFLWQYVTGNYASISVVTAGNQVSAAKGMQADVTISDITTEDSSDSKGTIGSLNATLTWTAAGIKDTVVESIPVIGSSVTDVTTDASAGTISITLGDTVITAKPVVTDGDLNLELVDANPLVQSALDELTKKLNDSYPLGIKADSVEVTDAGVVGKFSTQNATIPKSDSDGCFDSL